MASKGAIAKQIIVDKLKTAFGNDYVGESASKHYFLVDDGGEKVQIAVSLTCPKVPLGEVNTGMVFGDGIDFAVTPIKATVTLPSAEITQEEKDNIADLMAKLGL